MSTGFPQAIIAHSALPNVVGGTFTMLRGISPGVGLLQLPAEPQFTATVGDLTIEYAGVQIVIRNCAINTHTLQREMIRSSTLLRRPGPVMWTVQVMDRRWAWRYKRISGMYNERMPNDSIKYSSGQPEPRKTLRELAELCLNAMNESSYDTSVLPTNVYPAVNWQDANPAAELQTLCDMVGCVVVYDWQTDSVMIRRISQGNDLPTGDVAVINDRKLLTVARRPDSLVVACGPTRYQVKFLLEAVGLDSDGMIRRIDELTYAPSGGWTKDWWCAFPNVDDDNKYLAFDTVFRWYRIKGVGVNGDLSLPGSNEYIQSIDQFEVEDVLLEIAEDPDSMPQTVRGVVSGEFWPQCPWEATTDEGTIYGSSGWRLLRERKNIVEFDYPVLKAKDGQYSEAKMYLTCVCKLRKSDNSGYVAASYERFLPWQQTGAGPRILKHHELWQAQVLDVVRGATGSTEDAATESQIYLDEVQQSYSSMTGEDVSYDGIVPIVLDGAIAQVQWKVGMARPSETRASRNHEFDAYTPCFEQRRRTEKTNTVAEMELM